MGELHDWLRKQPPGLKTYRVFRDMLAQAAASDPGHRAVYRLLADLTSGFEDFDEEPMPPDLAEQAFARLLQIVDEAERSLGAPIENQIATLNEIAATRLY